MNHTSCLLCNKEVSWPGLKKHFFAREHIETFIQPLLLAQKENHSVWRKSTVKSCPVQLWKGDKCLHICFGCQTVRTFLPSTHLQTCPHAEAHITALKDLLNNIPEESCEGNAALEKKIAALEKKIKEQKVEIKMLEEARDDIDVWTEKIFGKSATDMSEYDIEYAIEDAKKGKVWKKAEEEEE